MRCAHAGLEFELIQQCLPLCPGFSMEVLQEVDSTNTELMRRARGGRMDPVLLVALKQTAGRGRMGRPWLSQPDQALTFSLGLELPTRDWSGLSLAVGLSVAQSLHPDIRLKWPNDLWWHQRKLGGILIETASLGSKRYGVIGVGINLVTPQSAALSTPAAGLWEATPGVNATEVLVRVVPDLIQAVQRFAREGFAPFASGFLVRDALRGWAVTLSDGTQGVAQGVNEVGALLVHTAGAVQAVTSSEVSVRLNSEPNS